MRWNIDKYCPTLHPCLLGKTSQNFVWFTIKFGYFKKTKAFVSKQKFCYLMMINWSCFRQSLNIKHRGILFSCCLWIYNFIPFEICDETLSWQNLIVFPQHLIWRFTSLWIFEIDNTITDIQLSIIDIGWHSNVESIRNSLFNIICCTLEI